MDIMYAMDEDNLLLGIDISYLRWCIYNDDVKNKFKQAGTVLGQAQRPAKTKSNYTKPNHNKPYQTKPYQTIPNQTMPNHTKSLGLCN